MTDAYRFLAISGSLRATSTNTEVLRAAATLVPPNVALVLYEGLPMLPPFNPDLDTEGAQLPASVRDLRAQVDSADAIVMCSPEYAHGVPGSLKNALDWLVSGHEIPYKPIGLINASPRSTHAHAQLAETLRTMSTVLVPDAALTLAVARGLDAPAIAADHALAATLRFALVALTDAAATYRQRRAELRSA